jgi:hypothetical protein
VWKAKRARHRTEKFMVWLVHLVPLDIAGSPRKLRAIFGFKFNVERAFFDVAKVPTEVTAE